MQQLWATRRNGSILFCLIFLSSNLLLFIYLFTGDLPLLWLRRVGELPRPLLENLPLATIKGPPKIEPKVFKLPTFVIFLEFCCCRFFIRPAWWTVPMTTSSAVHSDFLVVGISVSFGRCHGGNPQSARPIRRHRDVPFSILIDENPADGSPGELGALLPLDPLSI